MLPNALNGDAETTGPLNGLKSSSGKALVSNRRVLVVEDEIDLADLIAYNLHRAGYDTDVVHDGQAALARIRESTPDLVVLDIMIPKLSGLEVAREIRTGPRTTQVPVLMLTAKAAEADEIAGLAVGADDYITKPFSVKVLLARIEALLRRHNGTPTPEHEVIRLGPVAADLATHNVTVDDEPLKVTLTEFRLIVALVRARGKALSRYELMSRAMGPGVMVTTRTIDVHVAAIRKKLGKYSPMIRTVRGVGYRMSENTDDVGEPDGVELDVP